MVATFNQNLSALGVDWKTRDLLGQMLQALAALQKQVLLPGLPAGTTAAATDPLRTAASTLEEDMVIKVPFSQSDNFQAVIVVETASPGTTIHTIEDGGAQDELWLWAFNSHSSDVVLSLEFGDTTSPIVDTVTKDDGLKPMIPGLPLSTGTLAAFADTASVIYLFGYVLRRDTGFSDSEPGQSITPTFAP